MYIQRQKIVIIIMNNKQRQKSLWFALFKNMNKKKKSLKCLSLCIITTFMTFKTYSSKFFKDKIIIMTNTIETKEKKIVFKIKENNNKQTLHQVELNYDQ